MLVRSGDLQSKDMVMWWIISIAYMLIAVCFYRFFHGLNEDFKQRKHYNAHPERYPVLTTWEMILCSILWPFQVLGFILGAMGM